MSLNHLEFQGCADVTRSNAPLAVKTCVVTNLTFSHHQCDGIERSYDVIVGGWRVGAVIIEWAEAAGELRKPFYDRKKECNVTN